MGIVICPVCTACMNDQVLHCPECGADRRTGEGSCLSCETARLDGARYLGPAPDWEAALDLFPDGWLTATQDAIGLDLQHGPTLGEHSYFALSSLELVELFDGPKRRSTAFQAREMATPFHSARLSPLAESSCGWPSEAAAASTSRSTATSLSLSARHCARCLPQPRCRLAITRAKTSRHAASSKARRRATELARDGRPDRLREIGVFFASSQSVALSRFLARLLFESSEGQDVLVSLLSDAAARQFAAEALTASSSASVRHDAFATLAVLPGH